MGLTWWRFAVVTSVAILADTDVGIPRRADIAASFILTRIWITRLSCTYLVKTTKQFHF